MGAVALTRAMVMVSSFVTFLFFFYCDSLFDQTDQLLLRCALFLGDFCPLRCMEITVLMLCVHVTGLTAFEGTLVNEKKKS